MAARTSGSTEAKKWCVLTCCAQNTVIARDSKTKLNPIGGDSLEVARRFFLLDGFITGMDTSELQHLFVCQADYLYAKKICVDRTGLHAMSGLSVEEQIAIGTMEFVLSRCAGWFPPAVGSCVSSYRPYA
eukprot:3745410-Prymnesium_polylepis.1